MPSTSSQSFVPQKSTAKKGPLGRSSMIPQPIAGMKKVYGARHSPDSSPLETRASTSPHEDATPPVPTLWVFISSLLSKLRHFISRTYSVGDARGISPCARKQLLRSLTELWLLPSSPSEPSCPVSAHHVHPPSHQTCRGRHPPKVETRRSPCRNIVSAHPPYRSGVGRRLSAHPTHVCC
jgi:hypothetical protein